MRLRNHTRKLIVGTVGLLALGGVGTGVAVAQTAPNPSTTTQPPPASPTRPDPDHVQQGDQHGNDQADSADRPDASDGQDGHEQADTSKDPEGNHQDPNGVNVDHTPTGERPETGSSNAES